MDKKSFRIAIIGGGIAGLSFAISLNKLIPNCASRLIVDIYEATSSLEAQVGAGIGLWPYSWGIIELLGLDKELAQYGGPNSPKDSRPSFRIRKSDTPELNQELFTIRIEASGYTFHRADLQAVLLRNVSPSFIIHTKKRLQSYNIKVDAVVLCFEDGSSASCDLVVGADGLQSNVRRAVMRDFVTQSGSDLTPGKSAGDVTNEDLNLQKLSNPHWTGCIMYREVTQAQKLRDAGWGHHPVFKGNLIDVGRNGSIMSHYLPARDLINFVGFKIWPGLESTIYDERVVAEMLEKEAFGSHSTSKGVSREILTEFGDEDPWAQDRDGGTTSNGRTRWVSKAQPSEVKNAFRGWAPDMQALIDQLETPLRWSIHAAHHLPTFKGNKACVIGDAAHAMRPNVGHGASQGIADGFVLAKLIAYAIEDQTYDLRGQLSAILSAYDGVRRPVAQSVAEMARNNSYCWVLLSQDDDGTFREFDVADTTEAEALHRTMARNWSLSGDKRAPFEEAARAISLFKRTSLSASTGL